MGPRDLYNKLHDEPFKSFRVRLTNGSSIDVLDACSVILSDTSAIMPLEYVDDDGSAKVEDRLAQSHGRVR